VATSFPRPEGGDKKQSIPKALLVALVLGVLVLVGVTAVVLTRNHGGTSAGRVGQPADAGSGPQAGAEGPASNGASPMSGAGAASGQGGGPGAQGQKGGMGAGSPSAGAGGTGGTP
jgi:hypothetical protein